MDTDINLRDALTKTYSSGQELEDTALTKTSTSSEGYSSGQDINLKDTALARTSTGGIQFWPGHQREGYSSGQDIKRDTAQREGYSSGQDINIQL